MKEIEELKQVAIERQWFHTIYAALSTNRPPFMKGESYEAAEKLTRLAWENYCRLGVKERELDDLILTE